jgi:hypothetical protein
VTLDEFRILIALELSWTVSINGKEFLHLRSDEIEIDPPHVRFGRLTRKILSLHALRPNVARLQTRAKLRRQIDVLTFYAGDLTSVAELQRRRRAFLRTLSPTVAAYFGTRVVSETLRSDRQRGIGGAYPRFLVGKTHAAIAVDPDESLPVINAIVRNAILWAEVASRRVSIIVPAGRSATIKARVKAMPKLKAVFEWLEWDGDGIRPMRTGAMDVVETHVQPYFEPDVGAEVERIVRLAPQVLQAVPHIAGRAISVRLRGLEVARVTEDETTYPLGEPLEPVIESLDRERRVGSRHPLARAHEEAWLESNLIGQIRDLLPVRTDCIYPQVPSFAGEDRKIIDLLTATDDGRLVVIEIKASADADLPFQAFDYWLAVERHRKAGDFKSRGYFRSIALRDEPALVVIVAPLLSFHRTLGRLTNFLPATLPLMAIGINQGWKKEIKVLRRKGALR